MFGWILQFYTSLYNSFCEKLGILTISNSPVFSEPPSPLALALEQEAKNWEFWAQAKSTTSSWCPASLQRSRQVSEGSKVPAIAISQAGNWGGCIEDHVLHEGQYIIYIYKTKTRQGSISPRRNNKYLPSGPISMRIQYL